MNMRPEAQNGRWDDHRPTGDDYADWQPWKPGDPPVTDEWSSAMTYDRAPVERGSGRGAPADEARTVRSRKAAEREEPAQRTDRGSWWTERQPVKLAADDKVKATRDTGGAIMAHVPKGTEGRVLGTRTGLTGGEFARVEFANGYTEEVKIGDIEKLGGGWW